MRPGRVLRRTVGGALLLAVLLVAGGAIYLYTAEQHWGPYLARWLHREHQMELSWQDLDLSWPLHLRVAELRFNTPSVHVAAREARAEVLVYTLGSARPTVEIQGSGVRVEVTPQPGEQQEPERDGLPQLPVTLRGDIHRGVRLVLPEGRTLAADSLERVTLSTGASEWRAKGRISELQFIQDGAPINPSVGVRVHELALTPQLVTGELSVHRGSSHLRVAGHVPWRDLATGSAKITAKGAVQLGDPELRAMLADVLPYSQDVDGTVDLEASWRAPVGVLAGAMYVQVVMKGEALRWRDVAVRYLSASLRGTPRSFAGEVRAETGVGAVKVKLQELTPQSWRARSTFEVSPVALLKGSGVDLGDPREGAAGWLPARMWGQLRGRGSFTPLSADLHIEAKATAPPALAELPVSGKVVSPAGTPLRVQGRVQVRGDGVSLAPVTVTAPGTHLRVRGAVWPRLNAKLSINRRRPVQWNDWSLKRLRAEGQVRGETARLAQTLRGAVSIKATGVDHPRFLSSPATMELKARARSGLVTVDKLEVSAPSLERPLELSGSISPAKGTLRAYLDGPAVMRVEAEGLGRRGAGPRLVTRIEHIDLERLTRELGVEQDIRGTVAGKLVVLPGEGGTPQVEAALRIHNLRYGERLQSPTDLVVRVDPVTGEGGMHRFEITGDPYLRLDGTLDTQAMEVSVQGRVKELSLARVSAELEEAQRRIVVSSNVRGFFGIKARRGEVTLAGPEVELDDQRVTAREVTVRISPEAVLLQPTELQADSLTLKAGGQLWPSLSVDVAGEVDVAMLAVLVDAIEIAEGQLGVQLAVRGLEDITGTVRVLQPVRVAVEGYPRPLVLQEAYGELTGSYLELDHFRVDIARGSVVGSGRATWSTEAAVEHFVLTARARDVPYSDDHLAVLLDADLTWEGDLERSALRGEVYVVRADYERVLELNPFALLTTRSAPPPPLLVPPWLNNVDLDVAIESRQPVEARLVAGSIEAEVAAEIKVTLQGSAGAVAPRGRVAVVTGELLLPAAELEVTQGEVDLSPQLITVRLLAEGEVEPARALGQLGQVGDPYWVQVLLEGDLDEGLELHLTSSPPEDELGVLGLLITGATPSAQGNGNLLQARTALSFASDRVAGYLLGPATQGLRDIFGESFDLTANVTEVGLALGAQQRFTRRFVVGVGFEQAWARSGSLSSARAQLLLTDRLRLETQFLSQFGATSTEQALRNTTEARLELKYRVWGP